MTGDYKIILPLMISCVIATLVLKWISKDSIYTMKLKRRGIDILKINKVDLLERIKVSEAMFKKKIVTVTESTTLKNAEILLKSTSHKGFPVVDDNGLLKGMVTQQDINNELNKGRGDLIVGDVMSSEIVFCFPDETLKDALVKLGTNNIGRIPVVESNNPLKLIGLVTRKCVVEAYNKELQKK
jgi:chloride channel protein, CIC family